MVFLYVLAGLLGAAALIFTLQNPEPVAVAFLKWRTPGIPLSVLLLLAAFVGIVLASMSAFPAQIKLERRIRRLKRELAHQRGTAEDPAQVEQPRIDRTAA